MTKKEFELLDLAVFSVIGMAAECINLWAFSKFSGDFYVSFAVVLGLIAMVRWGAPGAVVTILTGASSVLYDLFAGQELTMSWILSNTIGYLPILLEVLWFKFGKKEKIEKISGTMILYTICGFFLTDVGKSLCYIGSADVGSILKQFFALDLINWAVGILVMLIGCKQKKLVYDMNDYLIEVHSGTPTSSAREDVTNYHALEEMADNDEVSDISLLDGGCLSEGDLKKMNETYKKMEKVPSKYDKENKAIQDYKDSKKKDKEDSGKKDSTKA